MKQPNTQQPTSSIDSTDSTDTQSDTDAQYQTNPDAKAIQSTLKPYPHSKKQLIT